MSARESEIVNLATQGLTDKEIALDLGIRFTSVKSHWARIRRKLQAANRAQVIALQVRRDAGPAVPNDLRDELQRLRACWSTLMQHSPLFVAVMDGHGRVQWCGQRDLPQLAENLIGRPIADLVTEDSREKLSRALAAAMGGQTVDGLRCEFALGDRRMSCGGALHPIREGESIVGALAIGELLSDPLRSLTGATA